MNSKDQYKRIISFASSVLLVALLAAGFGIVWYYFYKDSIMFPYYRRGNWVLIGIYTLLVYLFFKVYGAFHIGYLKKTDMFYSELVSMFCVNVVAYFMISLIARDFVKPFPMLVLMAGDVVILLFWIFLTNKFYFSLYPPRRLAIIYGSSLAAELVYKMSLRIDKYIICESIKYDENMSEIKNTIMKYDGVIICDIPSDDRKELLKYCYSHALRAYVSPEITDIIMRGAEDVRLFDTPLIVCKNYGLTFEQKLFKRIFDLSISIILAVVLLPFSLLAAAAIKIYDRGPVFYTQERLTTGGKPFRIYKFRSMVPDAEKNGAVIATAMESSITPVGRVLRACRLDEVPQLLNIIKGDMSIVGPRPERPELARDIEKDIPDFNFRLRVKAGLTGYAQVIGTYDTTPLDKLKMDLMYIENYSLMLDIQIILMTLKTVFFPPETNKEREIPLHDANEEDTRKKERNNFR